MSSPSEVFNQVLAQAAATGDLNGQELNLLPIQIVFREPMFEDDALTWIANYCQANGIPDETNGDASWVRQQKARIGRALTHILDGDIERATVIANDISARFPKLRQAIIEE